MRPETEEYLQKQSIEALDATYEQLVRLAKQGIPEAKERIVQNIELRARISGDMKRLAQQRKELDSLPG